MRCQNSWAFNRITSAPICTRPSAAASRFFRTRSVTAPRASRQGMVATAKMLSSTAARAAEKSLASMSSTKCTEMEATTNMRSPNQNTTPQKASEPNASRGVRSRLGVTARVPGRSSGGGPPSGTSPSSAGAVAHQEERDGKADGDNHDSRSAGRDSPVVRVDEVLEERDQEAADAEANRRNGEGDGPGGDGTSGSPPWRWRRRRPYSRLER